MIICSSMKKITFHLNNYILHMDKIIKYITTMYSLCDKYCKSGKINAQTAIRLGYLFHQRMKESMNENIAKSTKDVDMARASLIDIAYVFYSTVIKVHDMHGGLSIAEIYAFTSEKNSSGQIVKPSAKLADVQQ